MGENAVKLDPNEVLYAYTQGFFPMAHPDENNQVYWHKPKTRGIIPLDKFKASKNLRRLYRNGNFDYFVNRDFEGVITACSKREDTWISKDIISTYSKLNKLGYCYSFETWQDGELVGGLYGVAMGTAFFGESMFHRVTDASKLALVFLVEHLNEYGFTLLDTQYLNPHLKQFGAVEISDSEFEVLLAEALSGFRKSEGGSEV